MGFLGRQETRIKGAMNKTNPPPAIHKPNQAHFLQRGIFPYSLIPQLSPYLKTKILPRMLIRQDIPLFCHCHMCIYLCYINRAMPKHFLDISDIYVRLQEARSESMAEHMGRDMQLYCGEGGVLVYHPADRLV